MNATANQLLTQLLYVQGKDWMPFFATAAKTGKTTDSHMLAVGSRETKLKNIRGDYRNGKYNGFGVMQVDIGTDAEYARAWSLTNAKAGIIRGGEIYATKTADTKACVGKSVKVRSKTFTGKAVEPDDLRRISTAAYNCGRWAHYHFSRGEHIDRATTGADYSRDVYDRAIHFAAMLGGQMVATRTIKKKIVCTLAPDARLAVVDETALGREIKLQGKYCRPEHAALIGQNQPGGESLPLVSPQGSDTDLAPVDYYRDGQISNQPQTDQAIESSTSQKLEEDGKTVEETTVVKNEQDVNKTETINEPKPYNNVGFWQTIKGDLAKIGVTNGIAQTATEYGEKVQSWGIPQTLIIKLAYLVALISIGYLLFRAIHFVADRWQQNQRAKTEALINTDVTRKNFIFVSNKETE